MENYNSDYIREQVNKALKDFEVEDKKQIEELEVDIENSCIDIFSSDKIDDNGEHYGQWVDSCISLATYLFKNGWRKIRENKDDLIKYDILLREKVNGLEDRVKRLENIYEETSQATIKVLQSKINCMEYELRAKGLPSFNDWIKEK